MSGMSVSRGPTKLSIGVFSIATNRYIKYWQDMAASADKNLFVGQDVVLTVFSDQISELTDFEKRLERVRVNAIKVKALEWPQAPLSKFRMVSGFRGEFDQDILMHLDADMLVAKGAGDDLRPSAWEGGIALVRHPGFRRPLARRRAEFYLSAPGTAVRDAYRTAVEGGLGTWETNVRSRAFVPRHRRITYVCGATWLAQGGQMLELCAELSERVDRDLGKGIIARFHDESHLNWLASSRSCTILDSDYCFVENAQNLMDLRPRIVAVEKYGNRTR